MTENANNNARWTTTYRGIVLTALIAGFGTIINNLWSYGVTQRDLAIANTQLLNVQAGTLKNQAETLANLNAKLDKAFDQIAASNQTVVAKLSEIQHQIDLLSGRVNTLEDRRR